MNKCRSDGELRAFLDGELPPLEMEAVASHAASCAACGKALADLTKRADRIAAMMGELADGATSALPIPQRAAVRPWRWVAVTAALAAGVAVAVIALPRRPGHGPEGTPNLPHKTQSVAQVSDLRPSVAAAPEKRSASAKKARTHEPEPEYFFALDDDPIELGVIQRVALGPDGIPADVVFSPDGRARAIRLVSDDDIQGERR